LTLIVKLLQFIKTFLLIVVIGVVK